MSPLAHFVPYRGHVRPTQQSAPVVQAAPRPPHVCTGTHWRAVQRSLAVQMSQTAPPEPQAVLRKPALQVPATSQHPEGHFAGPHVGDVAHFPPEQVSPVQQVVEVQDCPAVAHIAC